MSMTATVLGALNHRGAFELFCKKRGWSQIRDCRLGSGDCWMVNVTGAPCNGSPYSAHNLWIDAKTGSVHFDSDYSASLQPFVSTLYHPTAKLNDSLAAPSDEFLLCQAESELLAAGLKQGVDYDLEGSGSTAAIVIYEEEPLGLGGSI